MKVDYDELREYSTAAVESVLGANHPDTEDIVQESLVRMFKSQDKFLGKCSIKTWASQVSINRARTFLSREKPKYILCSNFGNLNLSVEEDLAALIEPVDEEKLVREALPRLSEKKRQSVQGILDGKDGKTIGAEMGLNRETVYRLQAQAKRELNEMINGAIDV